MHENKFARVGLFTSLVVFIALFAGSAARVWAQDEAAAPPSIKELPIKHASDVKLTEQQTKGAGIFIQHCALCHLDKTFGSGGSKYCCIKSLGPRLGGMFKDLSPAQEKAMRDFIMNGGPTYMPAWKYALEPKEIDDIIAYLKTLE